MVYTPADIRYHSGPGGFCNVAELEFYEASVWGWFVVSILSVGGVAYVLGGGVYGRRVSGAGGGRGLLTAHPHHTLWVEIIALCEDGVSFTRAGGRRAGYRPASPEVAKGHKRGRGASERGEHSLTSQSGGRSRKEKKEKKKKDRTTVTMGNLAAADTDSNNASPQLTPATGTRAGDGGRWVHVPN